MRMPKLPTRREASEVTAAKAETGHTAGNFPSYNDVPLPDLPPPPLTSELTKSIRFSVSEPQGYYFEQVESFVQQVVDALAYYEQAEFQYRQTLYDMQVEADQQAYDAQRLRSEIELFKVQGSPLVNPDGSYVTESQQSASEAALVELAQANSSLMEMQETLVNRETEIVRLQNVAAAQDQDIVSLRQWGDQVAIEMASLSEQLVAAREQQAVHGVVHVDETTAPVYDMAPADTDEVEQTFVIPDVLFVETDDGYDGDDYDDDYDYDDDEVGVDLVDSVADGDPGNDTQPPEPYLDDSPGSGFGVEGAPVESGTDETVVGVDVAAPEADNPEVPAHEEPLVLDEVPVCEQPAEEDEEVPAYEEPTVLDEEVSAYEESAPVDEAPYTEPPEVPADEEPTPLNEDVPAYDEVPVYEQAPQTSEEVPAYDEPAPVDEVTYTEAPEPDAAPSQDSALPGAIQDDEGRADAGDDDEFDPYAEYDEAGEGEPNESTAVVPVDSELPEGTELPGTGEAAITYPPAAPGIPLETHGVPYEVWAPELDPRLRAAIEGDPAETNTKPAQPDTKD